MEVGHITRAVLNAVCDVVRITAAATLRRFLTFLERYFVGGAMSPAPESLPAASQPGGARLAAITVYPIKSCGGFAVDQWEVADKGLRCAVADA
jgi:hypothetical protein